MSSGISALLDTPLFSGSPSAVNAPLPYPVAIDGRGYLIDFSFPVGRRLAFGHQSIDMLRPQSDTSNITGEQSLNPESLWRRSQSSWHSGAGQTYLDRDDSISSRFRSSKGLNPWTKYQLTLLNDTALRLASANTNLRMVTVGSYLYLTDGTALKYTQDMTVVSPSFTTVTGTGAAAPTSICSDGFNVYTAHVANGLYTTTRGAAAATQLVTSALASDSICAYVKGRLMVSKGAAIYNITSTGAAALPTALFTQANTDWVWTCFGEGPANVYAAGFSGDKSLIYRTGILTDGTALAAPVVAGELPDGEIIRSMQGYLGLMVIGSDKGVRLCEFDAAGNLLVGDLIATTSAVSCFEPQDRFVWYGLTNYDATSTGLGRLDLRTFNLTAPAYASDLMATVQGAVQSAVTFQSIRMFSVSGSGFYAEDTTKKVASGTIDSGFITYGIVDQKVAMFLNIDTRALVGSITTSLSLDGGSFATVGSYSLQASVAQSDPTSQTLTDHFEVRVVLTRNSSTDTTGPTLLRYTLRANPAAITGMLLSVPIRLHEELKVGGIDVDCVPSTELALLDDLRTSRRVALYQEGNQSFTITVEGLHWLPESFGERNQELNGTCVVSMKTVQ